MCLKDFRCDLVVRGVFKENLTDAVTVLYWQAANMSYKWGSILLSFHLAGINCLAFLVSQSGGFLSLPGNFLFVRFVRGTSKQFSMLSTPHILDDITTRV